MIYRIYVPMNPLLQQYVQMFWYIAQDHEQIVGMDPKMIPDGHYHLVVNLGDRHHYIDKNGKQSSPQMTHINAKQTEFLSIIRSGHVEIIGIVFKPYGLFPLLKMPVSEISGFICNMEDLMGSKIVEIQEILAEVPTCEQKFRVLEHWLSREMNDPSHEARRHIVWATEQITAHHGNISIRQLADSLHVSERTLERHFQNDCGMTAKQFAIIQKIQTILQRMAEPSSLSSLQQIDYVDVGQFYDQSHFIHTFK